MQGRNLNIAVGAFMLLGMIALAGKRKTSSLNQQKYRETWMAIEQGLGNDEASIQLAIIKADKLLDQALASQDNLF